MFRFYELYSLYLKKMSSYGSSTSSTTWCLCEKLPRSILHIAPPSTPEHWCEVCGRRRRPRACFSSSSDEEEGRAAKQRQLMLAEQRRKEEEEEEVARQDLVRVKVTMAAKKPKPGQKGNCFKCGGQQKQPMNVEQVKLRSNNNNRLYIGRFGHYRKLQRVHAKRRDERHEVESKEQLDIEPHPTAPPPPPSPPPSGCGGESVWEQPNKDMPNLVAFAHEVFNRPLHLRKCQSNFYDNLFVSDFIPLDKPITDAAGGAVSKRRRLNGRPLRSHYSRPLPPLSQVLSQILAKQKVRAKGGGLPAKEEANKAASQFSPFDSYEGPSEDALVVESARQMLRQPKALHIKERTDLPTTRLSSFDSEPSSDCSSSSPFDMPTAPPAAERPRHSYSVGAPSRLHEMMKAVAQSGLSDSSASSSSTGSSSHKSASSTLPVLQQSVRSRGGEEPPYEEKPVEPTVAVEPLTIMEKILWLMEQKPAVDVVDPTEHKLESNQVNLMQFMERLHIKVNDDGWVSSTIPKNDTEDELKTTVDTPQTELQLSNDMSNELPLNSNSNKSAGGAKYVNGLSKDRIRSHHMTDSGGTTNSAPNSTTSMWSIISGFFTSKRSNGTSASSSLEEMKPLKVTGNLKYGSINQHRSKEELHGCRGKKSIDRSIKATNSNCQKCGLNLPKNTKIRKNCRFHLENLSCSSSYHTAKTTQTNVNFTKTSESTKYLESKNIQFDEAKKQTMKNILRSQDTTDVKRLHRIAEESATKTNLSFKDPNELQRDVKDVINESARRSQNISNFNDPKGVQENALENFGEFQKKSKDYQNIKCPKKLQRNAKKDILDYPTISQSVHNFKDSKKIQPKYKDDIPETPIQSQYIHNFKDAKKIQVKTEDEIESPTISQGISNFNDIAESTASSEILESGYIQTDIHLKKLLEKLRKRQPKFPTVLQMVKTIETVRFECGEIIQPKMVSSARETGQLKKYILKPMSLSKPFGLLEFRTPDVRKVESKEMETYEYENFEHSAQIKSCELTEASSKSESKISVKRHQLPVWPAYPLKHRSRQIKYKAMQMELSYTVDQKSLKEDYNLQTHREKNDRWLANELVQKKIHEMMSKPIKLLSFNEGTALETQ